MRSNKGCVVQYCDLYIFFIFSQGMLSEKNKAPYSSSRLSAENVLCVAHAAVLQKATLHETSPSVIVPFNSNEWSTDSFNMTTEAARWHEQDKSSTS